MNYLIDPIEIGPFKLGWIIKMRGPSKFSEVIGDSRNCLWRTWVNKTQIFNLPFSSDYIKGMKESQSEK
jgi:hypothetical protein